MKHEIPWRHAAGAPAGSCGHLVHPRTRQGQRETPSGAQLRALVSRACAWQSGRHEATEMGRERQQLQNKPCQKNLSQSGPGAPPKDLHKPYEKNPDHSGLLLVDLENRSWHGFQKFCSDLSIHTFGFHCLFWKYGCRMLKKILKCCKGG